MVYEDGMTCVYGMQSWCCLSVWYRRVIPFRCLAYNRISTTTHTAKKQHVTPAASIQCMPYMLMQCALCFMRDSPKINWRLERSFICRINSLHCLAERWSGRGNTHFRGELLAVGQLEWAHVVLSVSCWYYTFSLIASNVFQFPSLQYYCWINREFSNENQYFSHLRTIHAIPAWWKMFLLKA